MYLNLHLLRGVIGLLFFAAAPVAPCHLQGLLLLRHLPSSFALFQEFGRPLGSKRLDRLVVDSRNALACINLEFAALSLALGVHVHLEVVVDAQLVGVREAVLCLVIAVSAETMISICPRACWILLSPNFLRSLLYLFPSYSDRQRRHPASMVLSWIV